jgi:hypothetical protein
MRRWSWIAAGRRWRKTTLGVPLAIQRALEGREVGWGAPTYKQVRIAWNEAYKAAGGVAEFKITQGEVQFHNAGRIIFVSLDDPDNARGYTVDDWFLDEIGDIKPIAYYEVILPMLIENEDTTFTGLGTPRGRNWFFTEHNQAILRDDSIAFQIPTVGCKVVGGKLVREPHKLENPDIPFSEIQRAFEKMPQLTFKQEILAEFLEDEGAVFRNVKGLLEQSRPQDHKGHSIFFGIDWGQQQDYTVVIGICRNCNEVVFIDRFKEYDYPYQRKVIWEHHKRWKPAGVMPERNSMGDPVIQELQREGMNILPGPDKKAGFFTSATTKPPLIEDLKLALEKETLKLINHDILIAELLAYERKASASGRPTYSAPEGVHDDCVMALALAYNASLTGGFSLYSL